MEKSKGKVIALASLVVVLVGLIVALIIITNNVNKQSKTPNAVVEMSVNPQVELVVSENDKVLSVNYRNADAEIIFSESDLVGKNIEEVAKMFVEQATKAGYIDVDTTGTTVTITVEGKVAEKVKKLEEKIINKVNEYFDENGIIAGAIASAKADVANLANELGVTVEKYYLMLKAQALDTSLKLEDLKNETMQQLMDRINAKVEEFKGIATEKKALVEQKFNELYQTYETQKQAVLSFLSAMVDTNGLTFDEIVAKIQNAENIPEKTKETLITQLNAVKDRIEEFENTFKTEYNNYVETIKAESKKVYEAHKTELNNKIESAKLAIEQHKAQFESDKKAVNEKIKNYRDSLKQPA